MNLAKFDWQPIPAAGRPPRYRMRIVRLSKNGHYLPDTEANRADSTVYVGTTVTDLWVEFLNGGWNVVEYNAQALPALIPCGSKDEAFDVAEATYELSN